MIHKNKFQTQKIILILISICFIKLNAYCQFAQTPSSLLSPNSSSIGTPVSLYSGLPQIDIPIYTISDGPLQVPITLGYNSGGVKPEIHPGWLGLNWYLSAGGAITRQINGLVDEYNLNDNLNAGFYYSHGTSGKVTDDLEPDEFSFNFLGISGRFYMDQTGAFQMQGFNKNIKIMFINTTNPLINIPFGIQSSSTYNYNYGTFSGFILITEDGTQYTFGGSTDAIEYAIPLFKQNKSAWSANSWLLTKIKTIGGNEINFSYQRGNFIDQLYTSMNYVNQSCALNNIVFDHGVYDGQLISPVYLSNILTSSNNVFFNISSSNELKFSNSLYDQYYTYWQNHTDKLGTVFMPYLGPSYPSNLSNLDWKKLDNISIKDKYGNNVLGFDFNYNNSPTERLVLLSLTTKDKIGSPLPPYKFNYFSYNDATDATKQLPAYMSKSVDHWGYNNGRVNYIPQYVNANDPTDIDNNYVPSRATNPIYLYAGTLQQITNPNGGITEFQYEPHYISKIVDMGFYSSPPAPPTDGSGERQAPGGTPKTMPHYAQLNLYGSNSFVGGLRIKKILNYNNINDQNKITKEYLYVKNYNPNQSTSTSSGVLRFNPHYTSIGVFQDIPYAAFSSNSVVPMGINYHGTPVCYSEVVEKISNGGFTITKFLNFDTPDNNGGLPYMDELPISEYFTYYLPYSEKVIERGNPYDISIYNSAGTILQKNTILYSKLSSSLIKATRYGSLYYNCGDALSSFTYWISVAFDYKIYTYAFAPVKTETYNYDQNNPTKFTYNVSNLTYNSKFKLSDQKTFDSNGNQLSKHISYASEFPTSVGVNNDQLALTMLINQNMDPPVETYTYKTINGTNFIINSNYASFRPNPVNTSQIVPYQNFAFVANSPLILNSTLTFPTDQFTPLRFYKVYSKDIHYLPINTIQKYNIRGNARETSTSSDPNNIETHNVTIYDSNNNLPIAKISNMILNSYPAGPINIQMVAKPLSMTNSKVSQTSTTQLIDNVYYNSFEDGGSYTTGTSSLTGLYSFSSALTVPVPTVGNYILTYWTKTGSNNWQFNKQVISGGSTSIGGGTGQLLDEVRLYPADAKMKTFNYNIVNQIISETNENDQTVNYEYDGFGRVSFVKDQNKNIIKIYCYNYAGQIENCQVFNSSKLSQSFTKNNCTGGSSSPVYIYVVNAGKYSSSISQADANSKAQNEINLNGQVTANSVLTCAVNCLAPDHKLINGTCQSATIGVSKTIVYNNGYPFCHIICTYNFTDGSYSVFSDTMVSGKCQTGGCIMVE